MNPFITFRDTDKSGETQLYILQRNYPHYVGLLSNVPSATPLYQTPVAGHHLYLNFAGILRGNYIPSYQDAEKEIQIVFERMAVWFYSERILKEPKRYKKWAIVS